MKKTITLLLTCFLFFGCNNKDKEYGQGTDPQLNIEEYVFPKIGGAINIYSEIGYSLYVLSDYDSEVTENENTIIGSWYKVSVKNKNKEVHIEVQQNDTSEERELPFTIWSGNFRCKTNYIQKAN
jgi:hypothetical protein